MKQKKVGLIKRIKKAVIDFDYYKNFAEEKISVSIKYIMKLVLILSIIVVSIFMYKIMSEIRNQTQAFKENCPDFKIENNTLIVNSDNKQFITSDREETFAIVLNGERENITEIENDFNYDVVIALLKNKIVIKDLQSNLENSIEYKELSATEDISKEYIVNYMENSNITKTYQLIGIITLLIIFITYLIQILLDILVLSLVGVILTKIINIKLKYKSIFNMSVYALTFPIILTIIYMYLTITTGFEIKYFKLAYNAISYVYIITAMLMIKSDLIKQQIEVGRIVEEQKKIREEMQEEKEKEEQKQDNDEKENKKEKNKTDKDEGTPEGSKA